MKEVLLIGGAAVVAYLIAAHMRATALTNASVSCGPTNIPVNGVVPPCAAYNQVVAQWAWLPLPNLLAGD